MNSVHLIDGVSPDTLGLLTFRRTQRPILSQTVDVTETVPYRHGAYDFGATLAPRMFELEAVFNSRDYQALQILVSNLAEFLLDEDGRPRTMPIVFANQIDRQYMVRYAGDLQIDRIGGLGVFSLPFIAFDPLAYSAWTSDELNVDSSVSVDSDVLVDTDYRYSVTGSQTITVYNYGTLAAKPVFVITGSFTTLSLTVGGVAFTFSQATSGGTLEIDFARMTVKHNGLNALQYSNAQFGKLSKGANSVAVSGSGVNVQILVKFRMPYAA